MTASAEGRAVGEGSLGIGTGLRLASGLVLFGFVLTHLLNHSLGLISLDWMERGRSLFLALWRSPPGFLLLPLALLVHAALGVAQTLRLRSIRMPLWELLQKGSGLLIPVLLLPHIVSTRILQMGFGVDDSYAFELSLLWPDKALWMTLTLLLVWLHGCVGIHFWLRIRPLYRRVAPWLLCAAVVLPMLALGGFLNAGREVQRLRSDPAWLEQASRAGSWPDAETREWLDSAATGSSLGAAVVLGALAVLRALAALGRRRRSVRITYPDGVEVQVSPGTTILAASRSAGIPHASVCGGRGRCSTCRVRIERSAEHLSPPGPRERALLERVGMPENVRLACQVRPTRDVSVTPLLPPHVEPRQALAGQLHHYGRELEVAILFSDLRGFTSMTERRLPYDVVFVLNRYFRAMGETIRLHRGHLVQVFGDGMMALFAAEEGAAAACRQALRAASAMAAGLEQLNEEIGEPLQMGIGLHAGSAIVGEVGYREATIVTAVGEPVNAASRLQEATKEFGCQLVVSAAVADLCGAPLAGFERRELAIRGLTRPLPVCLVPRARDLPDLGEERITLMPPLRPRA